jgi:hypothetical protein
VHGEGTQTFEDYHSRRVCVWGIIAKLPPSWRDFATALKHKRVQMSISDLIASLDVATVVTGYHLWSLYSKH